MSDKQPTGSYLVTIFFFLMAIVIIGLSLWQDFNSEESNQVIVDEIKEIGDQVDALSDQINTNDEVKASEFPDYASLITLNELNLVEDFESWTPESEIPDGKVANEIIVEDGTLAKAYIYIRVSLSDKALTRWESIYIKMNGIGGHMFRPYSLAVPDSDKTELLYALDEISYLPEQPYSEQNTPSVTDWFTLFSDGQEIDFLAFISSLRPAQIEEITIYYECKDDLPCLLSKR